MTCRFPFTDCPGCDQCARPVYTLPPPIEPLRMKMVMLAFIGGAISLLAVVSFSGALERFQNVNDQHKEDVR